MLFSRDTCNRPRFVYHDSMNTTRATKFQVKLADLGDDRAAKLLKVTPRAIKAYRLGQRLPRPRQAPEVARRLGITLQDIYA